MDLIAVIMKKERMKQMIKPNCKNCYYSSCYSINERLASCNCSDIEELKEIKHGLSNSQWVRRDTWDEICNCKFFIPIKRGYWII